jgi:hypothetical protein
MLGHLSDSFFALANVSQFYSFSKDLPVVTSISSFTVLITSTDGATQTYDNNGNGFPLSDHVIVQTPNSCVSNGKLNVVAAVSNNLERNCIY